MLSALFALSLPLLHWPPPLPSPRPACSRAQPQLLPARLLVGRGLPPAAGQVRAGGMGQASYANQLSARFALARLFLSTCKPGLTPGSTPPVQALGRGHQPRGTGQLV